MHPDQIKAAAATVLTQIETQTRPANEILNAYTRTHRYIGSKDRRQLSDIVWGYLRARARLAYEFPNGDISQKIEAVLSGRYTPQYRPTGASDWVAWEVPEWLPAHLEQPAAELSALLGTAPTVLRANGNRNHIAAEMNKEGFCVTPTRLSPWGLILQNRRNLSTCTAYRQGRVEVQDEGSQMVALETAIRAGDTVLDYCAGAGGKTLAFAQMMQGQGSIVAHDISARSLKELEKRAERAHIGIIQTKPILKESDFPDGFSHVVVDAPCSGTGTWRRCPDARWKLTPALLADIVRRQADILHKASHFVRPHGYLSYMTCSLLSDENTAQTEAFLATHPHFTCIRRRQFSPALTGTDGLFIAVLQRVD
ncbi:MAG: RsmB/NOP family class I SAM-dependent RNA methyltransferase [Alphaproteobacteria bacterium]